MTDESKFQSPLSIYLVFHQKSDEARQIAHECYEWFRLNGDDGDRTEAGLPTWFRSAVVQLDATRCEELFPKAARTRDESELPKYEFTPAIEWDRATTNVVVILGDRELVADRKTRHALEALCLQIDESGHARSTLVLPIELHWSIHQLQYVTSTRNAVRVGDPIPEGVSLRDEDTREEWLQHCQRRSRVLRRALTESIAREFVSERDANQRPEPLNVFLSHAKRDGRVIAERLRDGVASLGQVKTWFDANDLPSGYEWDHPMETAAAGSAALVSVVTDAYPTRPWCRQEVQLARTPRPALREGCTLTEEAARGFTIWSVRPTVAVRQPGSQWSRPMAPLVHVPSIGWPEDDNGTEERLADVVDRMLLEVLISGFQRELATDLCESAHFVPPVGTHVAMLSWVPEPWSMVHVISSLVGHPPARTTDDEEENNDGPVLSPSTERIVLAYPGHTLRHAERMELEAVGEAISRLRGGSTRLEIVVLSQEILAIDPRANRNAAQPDTTASNTQRARDDRRVEPIVACLSGGGDDVEMERAGAGMPQVNDFFEQIARRLLEAGARIAYGGTLAQLSNNLTQALIDAARGWTIDQNQAALLFPDRTSTGPKATAQQLESPPFVNFSPWPSNLHLELEHHADLVGMCKFETVLPPNQVGLRKDKPFLRSLAGITHAANALSEMRRKTSELPSFPIRIVLGGKIAGARGVDAGNRRGSDVGDPRRPTATCDRRLRRLCEASR